MQHLAFIRTEDGKGQTFHIHFAVPESEFRREHLDIRDLCNSDPTVCRIYSDTKRLYSQGNEDARLSYRAAKQNLYEVLCQAACARRERLEGTRKNPSFLDDLFLTILGSLEEPAIVYDEERGSLLRKELGGNLIRAAVRLKECGVSKQERVLIAVDDIADQLTVILGAAFAGIVPVLTEEIDAKKLEEIRARTGARMILRDDFFDGLYSLRGHLREESHNETDEVLLFPYEDAYRSVSFGEITAAVETAAEQMQEEPDCSCRKDTRLTSAEEIISILACFSRGGTLYVQSASM
ncbi:MAG: GrpB family protein [Solobacterium sp.]|nr:GrpB family protein [Solobacterium sp.]